MLGGKNTLPRIFTPFMWQASMTGADGGTMIPSPAEPPHQMTISMYCQ